MILWDHRRISSSSLNETSLCGASLYLTSCKSPVITSETLNFEFISEKFEVDMIRATFVGRT